jgi:hypothetical protein
MLHGLQRTLNGCIMFAIVNFRTMANGSYKYMAGKRRGYWRTLLVRDLTGPTCIHSRNVVSVLYSSPAGIDGVTERSAYCIDAYREHAENVAMRANVQRLGANIAAAYSPI